MIKNAIRLRYHVLKALIEKYTPPIDLSGFGEVILERIDFSNVQGILTIDIETSGTLNGMISVIGKIELNESRDHIIFNVDDIKFVKLPLALKLTAGLLKQKVISVIESKAKISDEQVLEIINTRSKNVLSSLAATKGVDAQLELSDLKFVYVLTDNKGVEVCTELEAEPRIDITDLPS